MNIHRKQFGGRSRNRSFLARRVQSAAGGAPLGFEPLESRTLLSAAPWQNPHFSLDVNSDGRVTPLDALVVINELNANGAHALPATKALAPLAADGSAQANPAFLDVNGDGMVSSLDALRVVNKLNAPVAANSVQIRLQASDTNGNAIATVTQGTDFVLQAFVKDTSSPAPEGVFAAYLNAALVDAVNNPSTLISIDTGPPTPVVFGADYQNGKNTDTHTGNSVLETGAFSGANMLGPAEDLLWSVHVHTVSPGQVLINGSQATQPGHEVLVYGSNNPVPASQVTFLNTTITVLAGSAPSLSINDVSIAEGDAGTKNLDFTVTLSALSAQTVTVRYATADGTAKTSDNDYQAATGTLTFNPGDLTKTVSVPIIGDTKNEANETFTVNLSAPTNAAIAKPAGLGTILNDDAVPNLSINSVSVDEPSANTANATFTVTLSAVSGQSVTVNYATSDGSAHTPTDYVGQSGTLTFNPGDLTKTITVLVNGDNVAEPDQTFTVILTSPANADILVGTGTGTITNDLGLPGISINNVSQQEGNAGTTNMIFTVTLSVASNQTVTVAFATIDQTALAGTDYQAQSGTLTFAPGVLSQPISVPIIGNTTPQSNRSFFVNLSSATNGTIVKAQGIGTIIDDDSSGFTISDATIVEGASGPVNAVFTVSLSQALNAASSVSFATADGTATLAENDYVAKSGTLNFAAGVTTQTITIVVNHDAVSEPPESFVINLSNPVSATIQKPQGVGTILDENTVANDLVKIRLQISDTNGNPVANLAVGDAFRLQAFVDDLRGGAAAQGVFAAYLDILYTSNLVTITGPINYGPAYTNVQSGSTATAGLIDEAGASDGLTPLGPAEQLLFSVPMMVAGTGVLSFTGDPADIHPDHEVLLYGQNTAVPANQVEYTSASIQVGTNFFSIDNPSVLEGNSGTTNLVYTVTRNFPANSAASVQFATADGTAKAGEDYVAQNGTLNFAANQATATITVLVKGDTLFESDETLFVNLTNPVGATIGTPQGIGTILNDDAAPTISIASAAGNEGQVINFTVTLSAPSQAPITVQFATAAATSGNLAVAGVDYTATSGTVTFTAGSTTQTIPVTTLQDGVPGDPDKLFQVILSNPSAGTIAVGTAIGTIHDTVASSISGFVYVDTNDDGIKQANEGGIAGVTITATKPGTAFSQTVTTKADGSYTLVLLPGTYTVTETQPGFYNDGLDTPGTPPPIGAQTVKNQFSGVVVSTGGDTGYNFGELGLRPEFVSAFFNRRAFFASSIMTGDIGPTTTTQNIDLTKGDAWIAFDGGWTTLRTIQASFVSAQGSATLFLYDNNLNLLVSSVPATNTAQITWLGVAGANYFLRISGTNPKVSLTITDVPAPPKAPAAAAPSAVADSGGGVAPAPNSTSSSARAADQAMAMGNDWLLDLLA